MGVAENLILCFKGIERTQLKGHIKANLKRYTMSFGFGDKSLALGSLSVLHSPSINGKNRIKISHICSFSIGIFKEKVT